MTKLRTGRQKYYNIFSHFYDLFIKLHAHNYRDETRIFLVDSAQLKNKTQPKVLDICCGTGSVILSFAEKLKEKQKTTLLLRLWEDLPFKEIAAIMDCSENNAKVNFHHALKNMRNILKKEGVFDALSFQ